MKNFIFLLGLAAGGGLVIACSDNQRAESLIGNDV